MRRRYRLLTRKLFPHRMGLHMNMAMTKGEQTRQRILDIAETAVLSKGFEATSIDEIIAEAEITKSGFYYHFADKNMLARAMLKRRCTAR